jgi:hypothetical protein
MTNKLAACTIYLGKHIPKTHLYYYNDYYTYILVYISVHDIYQIKYITSIINTVAI